MMKVLQTRAHVPWLSGTPLMLLLFLGAAASTKNGASPSWAVPQMSGLPLFSYFASHGAFEVDKSSQVNSSLAKMAGTNGLIPFINLEHLLGRFIWNQIPQTGIDEAFLSLFTANTSTGTSKTLYTPDIAASTTTSTSNGSSSSATDGAQVPAADAPKTLPDFSPTLWHAVQMVLSAPQAINDSFVNVNELSHRKVWMAVAQAQAISEGRGACLPPGMSLESLAISVEIIDLGGDDESIPDFQAAAVSQDTDAGASQARAMTEATAAGGTWEAGTATAGPAVATTDTEALQAGVTSSTAAVTTDGVSAADTTAATDGPVSSSSIERGAGDGSQCSLADELQLMRIMVAALPTRYGMPLLRRLTIAALLQRRVNLARPFTYREQRQAVLLLLQLFAAHRSAALKKSVLEFFHISKAGGTSMCSLSQKNGCTTWDAGEKRNCLVYEFDDLPRWVSRKVHRQQGGTTSFGAWFLNFDSDRNQVHCARRRAFMQRQGWDMYAHEFTLVGGRKSPRGVQLCSEMLTMMQVRHPFTRLVSHLRWIYGLYHERPSVDVQTYWPNTSAMHWQHMAPPVVDNYYTRSLLGEGVYNLPVNQVESWHGKLAQLLVAQFDVLLVLEQAASRRLALNMGLGWLHNNQEEKSRSADDLMKRVQAQQASNLVSNNTGTTSSAPSASPAPVIRKLSAGASGAAAQQQGSVDGAATLVKPKHKHRKKKKKGSRKKSGSGDRHLLEGDTIEQVNDAAAAMDQQQATPPIAGNTAPDAGVLAAANARIESESNTFQPLDQNHPLIRAAFSEGVPKDLGELLQVNKIDIELYQFASWMSRFDALVHEVARLIMADNPYAGLSPQSDPNKQQLREQVREKKWKAYLFQQQAEQKAERQVSEGLPAGIVSTPTPAVMVPVNDKNTCGFVGY